MKSLGRRTMKKFIAPTLHTEIFDCPHCEVRAKHEWLTVYKEGVSVDIAAYKSHEELMEQFQSNPSIQLPNLYWEFNISVCTVCTEYMIWKKDEIIYPTSHNVEEARSDMPESVKSLYNEARGIVRLSPKSACALLRLSLEKLLVHLGCPESKRVVDNIKLLKEQGKVDEYVYDALESVRLVGNNAVHPGKINIDDNPDYAHILFSLLNYIVDELISRPARAKEFRESIRR
ncbi:hypothetical protein COK18_29420 [Bacillus cereus]|uniref:DUF4145 domain-containing protein n=2 Tax=Bacillus cereus TaxID=1396 RepID=A0AB34D282_BACCE|nr:DUF4145 domain-containing protein [Bacillus cereus]PFQ56692.1 hypothetical protein COK18_29420 [Bacillus cereus]